MTNVAERLRARSVSERPHCPKCKIALWPVPQQSGDERCDRCKERVEVRIFPAYHRAPEASRATAVVDAGEASCFYHPDKRAVAVCVSCGRFLCGHCACDWQGDTYCLSCLHALRDGGDKRLVSHVTHKDSVAFALALFTPLSLVGLYITFITAPAALFLAIRSLRGPTPGLLPRSRTRAIIALVLALLQIFGWVLLFGSLFLAV